MKVVQQIMILCVLIVSQAQSAVVKIEDPLMETHFKDFVQTHATLPGFVSAIVESVRLSKNKKVIHVAENFWYSCNITLSSLGEKFEEVCSFVKEYWTVHEEEKGDSHKHAAPDAAQGFRVMPDFQAWQDLQAKQKKHVTALTDGFVNGFVKRDLVDGKIIMLYRYLGCFSMLGTNFQDLLDDLAKVQKERDRVADIFQDANIDKHLKDFVQTQAALSKCVSAVVDSVSVSECDKVQICVKRFRESSDRALSLCVCEVKEVQSFVQQYLDVHEEEGGSQEYRNAVQGFSVMPDFKEWETLQAKQRGHVTALMNFFSTIDLVGCQLPIMCFKNYRVGVDKLGKNFKQLLDDLAVARDYIDRMPGIVQDSKCFLQTHAALSESVSVVLKSASLSKSKLVVQVSKIFDRCCIDQLLSSGENVKEYLQRFFKEYGTVMEEEKGHSQKDKCVAFDAEQGFIDRYSKTLADLQEQQRTNIISVIAKLETKSSPNTTDLEGHLIKGLKDYLKSVERLGGALKTLWEHLSLIQANRERMGLHLKGFVQTHAELSSFVSVVVDHASLSKSQQAVQAVKRFKNCCFHTLFLEGVVQEVQSSAQEVWNVHTEEKSDSQKYKCAAPDDVPDFSVTPFFPEWDRLEAQQTKHVTGLIDTFNTRLSPQMPFFSCESTVLSLECYQISFVDRGQYLNKLSTDLAQAKDHSDRMVLLGQHLKGFVQKHAGLSEFVSVVVKGVRSSHNNLAIGAVKDFQHRCDRELSCCGERVAYLQSCVQPYLDVREEEKSAPQEYRYVAPDDAQGFNVTPHFQGLEDLLLQQSKHITYLTEIFETSPNVGSGCGRHICKIYLESCSRIRDFLNELSVALMSAKAEGEKMALALHKFRKAQKDCKDIGSSVICCLDIVRSRPQQEGVCRNDGSAYLLRVFKENLQTLESIALKMQVLEQNVIVHEEEKGEEQEHKVIPHDDSCTLEACVSQYQKVAECQKINIRDLLEFLKTPLVVTDVFSEQLGNFIKYERRLEETLWSLEKICAPRFA